MNGSHERWMQEALAQARMAFSRGEIPIGAVVVRDDQVIGRGHNQRIANADPLAHAEVLAIRDAAQRLGSWRLDDATLYVTVEPCAMCAGSLVQARLGCLVFGARESKSGAVRSMYQLCDDPRASHRLRVISGVCEEACAAFMQQFFRERRKARMDED